MTQISPNPNIGVIRISDVEEHDLPKSFENEGKVIILSGGLFTNNAKYDTGFKSSLSINPDTTLTEIQNGGTLRNQGSLNVYSKLVNQEGGSCINNSNISLDGDDRPDAQFLNSGKFNNFFALDLDQSVVTNKASGVVNNGVSPQAGGAPTKATITLTDSTFNNFGKVENYGSLMGDGYIYIDNIDNATWTNYAGSQIGGNLTIEGIMRGSANYTPGSSAGGINIKGSLVFSEDSSKIIELGGDFDGGRDPSDTEYDYIDVAGNLDNRGGTLEVSLIDGFTLGRNQEFIISKVDGEVTGTYSSLVEGALVGKYDSIYGPGIQQDLYITYKAGDGNDIGLYTTKSVDRLYNSSEGRHLFSSNQNEIDILTGSGWVNEGTIYSAPDQPTAEVFRFYIPSENRHFYTALESERDIIIGDQATFSGWDYEGSAFSAYSTNDFPADAVAVVRYLNEVTGNHVYSTSTFEQGVLDQDSNWLNEGIAWYGDSMEPANDLITRTLPGGLRVTDLEVGYGPEAVAGQAVEVHYRGSLEDGSQFDSSYDRSSTFTFPLGAGRVIEGWDLGIEGMNVGGRRLLVIPSDLAYGSRGVNGIIPPNATLTFEVELLSVDGIRQSPSTINQTIDEIKTLTNPELVIEVMENTALWLSSPNESFIKSTQDISGFSWQDSDVFNQEEMLT